MIFSETMVAAHGVVAAFSDLGCCILRFGVLLVFSES